MARLSIARKVPNSKQSETNGKGARAVPPEDYKRKIQVRPPLWDPQTSDRSYRKTHDLAVHVSLQTGEVVYDGPDCLDAEFHKLFPPSLVRNMMKIEQDSRLQFNPQDTGDESEIFDGRQPLEISEARCVRLNNGCKKKRPNSSDNVSESTKRRKSKASASSADLTNSHDNDSDDEFVDTAIRYQWIKIGDTKAVETIFLLRFCEMQQLSCKQICKAWVRLKEPKKQARFPYNGGCFRAESLQKYGKAGVLTTPGWWPPLGCDHQEPDHLKKPARMILMIHLLRNVGLSCEDLEKSTSDLLNTLIPNKSRDVVPLLQEVHMIRKKEEAYLRGEIDGETMIPVRAAKRAKPRRNRKAAKKSCKASSRSNLAIHVAPTAVDLDEILTASSCLRNWGRDESPYMSDPKFDLSPATSEEDPQAQGHPLVAPPLQMSKPQYFANPVHTSHDSQGHLPFRPSHREAAASGPPPVEAGSTLNVEALWGTSTTWPTSLPHQASTNYLDGTGHLFNDLTTKTNSMEYVVAPRNQIHGLPSTLQNSFVDNSYDWVPDYQLNPSTFLFQSPPLDTEDPNFRFHQAHRGQYFGPASSSR